MSTSPNSAARKVNFVTLETPTARIEVSQPQEIAMYARMFDVLRQSALYGREARAILINVQNEVANGN